MQAATSLQSMLWPKRDKLLKETLLIAAGVLLIAIAAHLRVPLQPVPLTFQSATVIFISMMLGARLGTLTLCAYIIAGFLGFPVFTQPNSLFSPTAGYVIGFLPAAFVSGYLAQHGFAKNWLRCFIASCIWASIIFTFGLIVLASFIGWPLAFKTGLMPFLLTECIKLTFVSLIVPRCWKEKRKINPYVF